jgi:S-adenosylmethionine:tRNA ribosyltransferase-isomerase
MRGASVAATRFDLPDELAAVEPPEAHGVPRDRVRLLVARPDDIQHATFADLPRFLRPGDLLVVNRSATVAAALPGRRADGRPVTVHAGGTRPDGTWVLELRPPGRASGPVSDAAVGERIELPAGVTAQLRDVLVHTAAGRPRLWRADVRLEGRRTDYLRAVGRPIAYGYVRERWPLAAYQTVFAREPGSAEMPSAGRPFTTELVTDLVTSGIGIAPITLHTGLSSGEEHEPPLAEPFVVPEASAALVNHTVASGARVVATGTTVTRALESVAGPDGRVTAGAGWTDLVLSEARPARVVRGLITGWHAPGASHLMLLEAVAGQALVSAAYAEAVERRYLWHEFGDSCLLLP